ncbi:Bug family tripartite tricarboxylate transporter substrate binding protein [Pseudochelatococcus sp. B33]
MKAWIVAVAALAACLGIAPPAQADDYPSRPVKVVCPFGAGSAADTIARRAAQMLSAALGKQFVVENRPGASGIVATEIVAHAPGDGYTLLLVTNSTHAANASLFKTIPYDPVTDFAPIGKIASIPLLLVVHPSVPVNSVSELISYAKANPGKLNAAYSGSSLQVASALMADQSGINVVDIPYKTVPPALTDLVAGTVSYMFADYSNGIAQAREGKVRALAVTSATRMSSAPEYPTMMEAGFENYDVAAWFGLAAPAGTDEAIIRKISDALKQQYDTQETRAFYAPHGIEATFSSPDEFKAFIQTEIGRWADMIKTAKIEVQ